MYNKYTLIENLQVFNLFYFIEIYDLLLTNKFKWIFITTMDLYEWCSVNNIKEKSNYVLKTY